MLRRVGHATEIDHVVPVLGVVWVDEHNELLSKYPQLPFPFGDAHLHDGLHKHAFIIQEIVTLRKPRCSERIRRSPQPELPFDGKGLLVFVPIPDQRLKERFLLHSRVQISMLIASLN